MATSPCISVKCVNSLFHRHAVFKGSFSKKSGVLWLDNLCKESHEGDESFEIVIFFLTQLLSGTIQYSLSKIQCKKK